MLPHQAQLNGFVFILALKELADEEPNLLAIQLLGIAFIVDLQCKQMV